MSIHGIGGDCLLLGLWNGRYSIPSILLLKQNRQNSSLFGIDRIAGHPVLLAIFTRLLVG